MELLLLIFTLQYLHARELPIAKKFIFLPLIQPTKTGFSKLEFYWISDYFLYFFGEFQNLID